MKGRPPLPTHIKQMQGTLQKCRQTDNEMQVSRLGNIPEVPAEVVNNSYAVDAWKSMTETLFELNMLHAADLPMITLYAVYLGRAMRFAVYLEKEGNTFETPNGFAQPRPEVKMMNDAFDRANRLAGQFGFTPSARTKIGMPSKEEQNPFANHIK